MLSYENNSSDEEDQNFDEKIYKKIVCDEINFDSDNLDSLIEQQEDSEDDKNQSIRRKERDNSKDSNGPQKSKMIKKNCESAKMSRQRKKLYLQLLELKAKQYKTQIYQKKNNISDMVNKIMKKFKRSNIDKHNYIVEKLSLSQKLLSLNQEIKSLNKQHQTQKFEVQEEKMMRNPSVEHTPKNIQKIVTQQTLNNCNNINIGQEHQKAKQRKKRKDEQRDSEKPKDSIMSKKVEVQNSLQIGIKAYMYEFGARGCLRSDVNQRNKYEWLQCLREANVPESPSLNQSINKLKVCFQKVESKTKILDSCMRNLKQRVKQNFALQFLLDRQFFIHNNAQTIFKNSQMCMTQPLNDS